MSQSDLIVIEFEERELRALRRCAAAWVYAMQQALGHEHECEVYPIDAALAKCEMGLMLAGLEVE